MTANYDSVIFNSNIKIMPLMCWVIHHEKLVISLTVAKYFLKLLCHLLL